MTQRQTDQARTRRRWTYGLGVLLGVALSTLGVSFVTYGCTAAVALPRYERWAWCADDSTAPERTDAPSTDTDSDSLAALPALDAEAAREEREAAGHAPDLEWLRVRMADEYGNIPATALATALDQKRRMLTTQARTAAIGRTRWEALGPTNVGGRIRSLLIHPTNASILYAGGVRGGIWKSTDAGNTWAALDDFLPNLGVTALAFDPSNPAIIWAGTGEYITGGGIYRSVDSGAHWTVVAGTTDAAFRLIRRIVVTRVAGKTMVNVATGSGIFHTEDNGATWIQSLASTSEPLLAGVWDIEANPLLPAAMVATSTYNGVGLWYSSDGGISWSLASTDVSLSGRVELAYAPSQPSIVYATTQEKGKDLGGVLLKSTDGGQTYSTVNSTTPTVQGNHNLALWVDPTDSNALLLGAVDVFRSTDGGASFTAISNWARPNLSTHADQHLFVNEPGFNGSTNRAVFVANDGGISRMADYRAATTLSGWESRKSMLSVTQFYGIGGNPNTGMVIGGTQDNGNVAYNMRTATTEWVTIASGDGGMVSVNPLSPNMSVHEYVYLMNLTRRNSATGQQDYISGEYYIGTEQMWKSAPFFIPDAKNQTANFIAPIRYDPNSTKTLYAGGETLWRTNTADVEVTNTSGPAWEAVTPAPGKPISAIAIARGDSNTLWYGCNDGRLWKSSNATAAANVVAWTDVSAALPDRTVSDIWIDPADKNHVLVVFGGFSTANIWVTQDGGAGWTSVAGTGATALPQVPIYAVDVHPTNPDWIYVGTEIGVFSTENAGAAWSTTSEGPANAPVFDIDWVGTSLVLATHGRGAFSMDFAVPSVSSITVESIAPRVVRGTLTFSKVVTGVGPEDIVIRKTGTVRAQLRTVRGSGLQYTVDFEVLSGIGTIGFGLAEVPSITDEIGQNLGTAVSVLSPVCTAAVGAVACRDVVTTSADTGPGSLRQILADAPPGAVIRFAPALSGQTINVTNVLMLEKNVTIDATQTQVQITIDGGGVTGLFNVTPNVIATLRGLHLTQGAAYEGGVVRNSGTVTIDMSSMASNTATRAGAVLFNSGTATIVNSTLYANTARMGDVVSNQLKAVLSLHNVTIGGNTAGIAVVYNVGALTMNNTIIADSVGDGCYTSSVYGTYRYTAVISETGRCAATSTRDPQLLPPALNNGTTYTIALKTGSNARNTGNDAVCASSLVGRRDQRGMVRPAGGRCDIGAYEAGAIAPTATRTVRSSPTRSPTRTTTARTPTP